jgi:hypothetical protein
VCTEDVASSGQFLAAVIEGGQFLGTIRNQTTLKTALSKIDVTCNNTLFIVGHSDKNFGYLCKGKVLISKALSLAQGRASKIVFLMCYSSEMAERSYDIVQRTYVDARQRFQAEKTHHHHRRHRRGATTTTDTEEPPDMPFRGFVGIGHSCSTSGWGDDEELDLVSSVVLLVKSLSRWPQRSWSTIARGVPLPTSVSRDDGGGDGEEVTFTCGEAFGRAAHDDTPRVRFSDEQRARLGAALVSLQRELYDGNPHAEQPCGEEIV